MPKFEKKPPQVEAERWDGTLEGSEPLRALIRKARYNVGFRVITEFDRDMSEDWGLTLLTFDFPSGYVHRNHTMRKGDWLVMDHLGQLEIMDDEDFQRDYAPNSEELFQKSLDAFESYTKKRAVLDHSCSCHVNGNECGVCRDLKCPLAMARDAEALPATGWGCSDCKHNHTGRWVPAGCNPAQFDGRCLNDIFGGLKCGCARRRPDAVEKTVREQSEDSRTDEREVVHILTEQPICMTPRSEIGFVKAVSPESVNSISCRACLDILDEDFVILK